MKSMRIILAVVAILAIGTAMALAEPGGAVGAVKSVDAAAGKVVLTDKDGNDTQVTLREGCQVLKQEAGEEAGLATGVCVQIDGTVSEDQTSVDANRITYYIEKGRGFDLLQPKRVDGVLTVADGKITVTAKVNGEDKVVAVNKAENMQIKKRTWITSADITAGVNANCWGEKGDEGVTAGVFIVTMD